MLAFLDFEASSLNKDSYPIEVGWVTEDGSGETHLIRPAPGWTDWDEDAVAIHHITRGQLEREGEAHGTVCDRLIQLFETRPVFVSAPSWDGHWLSMLLRAAGHQRHLLRFRDSDEAFAEAAEARLGQGATPEEVEALVARVRAQVEEEPPTHRALSDARREWSIWQAIRASRT